MAMLTDFYSIFEWKYSFETNKLIKSWQSDFDKYWYNSNDTDTIFISEFRISNGKLSMVISMINNREINNSTHQKK